MGNGCTKKSGPGKKLTLALLGLDNAGKTVTTKSLIGESLEDVVPTIGFTKAEMKFDKYDITLYDVGGGVNIRDIWKNYFGEVYGVIFLVDSSEPERMGECKLVLSKLLENPKVKGKPVLLLGNKQDKLGALDEIDICENLNLEELVNMNRCPCRVETCAAIDGRGKSMDRSIHQGVKWLVQTIHAKFDELNKRVEHDVSQQLEREKKEKAEKAERVRKIREERAKKEEEERKARGEDENMEDEDNFKEGDPFKRVDVNELTQKEEKMKEEKRKKKEQSGHTDEVVKKSYKLTNSRSLHQEDSDDEDVDTHIPYQQGSRPVRNSRSLEESRDYHRDLDDVRTQSDLRFSMRTSNNSYPSNAQRSYNTTRSSESGDDDDDDDFRTSSSMKSPWGKKHTPRPLEMNPQPSLSPRLPQRKARFQNHDDGIDNHSAGRAVLPPLLSAAPLDQEKKKKKKKKKVKDNQTEPYEDEDTIGSSNLDNGYPNLGSRENWNPKNSALFRASRPPGLDTHKEANSADEGLDSHDRWNLDLPEVAPSYRRRRPNLDDEDDITT